MTFDLVGLLDILAVMAALLTVCSMAAVGAGAIAVHRFASQTPRFAQRRPAITVMKPLCGDEPLLEEALASICDQAYPAFQIVFGVQDAHDPALLVVERVQRRYPAHDITVVAEPGFHGPNRKISNLINMFPAARHEILVFSDSDMHVGRDYLEQIVAALEVPGAGLVTTVCVGLPTAAGPAARLGATGISHSFLPGALLSRAFGRQDCLGTTMALHRRTLERIGGLEALVRHLADDNVLATRVRQLGLRVGLASTVPMTAVPERSLRSLWQHELRWARTIRALEPVLFVGSVLQFPTFWAMAAMVLSGGSAGSAGLFAAAWIVRAMAAQCTDRALLRNGQESGAVPVWWLPLRDIMSVSQVAAGYLGTRVIWRGHVMRADDGRSPALTPE